MLKVEKLNENQKTKNKKVQTKNKGITLIALVITIIVILILAGVSINTLFGDNGLLTKAQDAVNANTRAGIKDQIVTEVFASYNNKGEIDKSQLNNNLKAHIPGIMHDGNSLEESPITTLPANVEKDGYKFTIESDGTVTDILVGGNSNTPEVNDKPTIPTGYTVSTDQGEDSVAEGLVISDNNGNEFVWIEVPKTKEVYEKTGLGITDFDKNYENIYNDLKAYSSSYGTPDDTFYDGCGFNDSTEYNKAKNKMLKSVYENGGFWIGRYEAGIEGSIETDTSGEEKTAKPRTTHEDITDSSPKAVSKPNKYPYNYVYCSEAQKLASEMPTSGELTSSLMFGVQWNLVCKFLENTLEPTDINSNSGKWGNYNDVSFSLDRGKYSTNKGSTWTEYTEDSGEYVKEHIKQGGSGNTKSVLLTTGASDRNCKLNIYDLAGNEYEWTLEKSDDPDFPCRRRGGSYSETGGCSASIDLNFGTFNNDNDISFRVTLY